MKNKYSLRYKNQNNIIVFSITLILISSVFLFGKYSLNVDNYKIKKCEETIFEFDKIEYYNVEIEKGFGIKPTQTDTLKINLLNDEYSSLKDSINLKNIELYYKKTNLNKRSLQYIRSYLCKNVIKKENYLSECFPVFRDILIFKKDSKIVGILKICFECGMSNLVSEKYNSSTFNCSMLINLDNFLKSSRD
jgi:hypothetical protein